MTKLEYSRLYLDFYRSALIAANESRPHFLINLFRELQLISSSDPLRKRLMQTFQDVYTQNCEQNGATIMLSDVHASSIVNVQVYFSV